MTAAITTREGIVVKVGQVWRDPDKRNPRTCQVEFVSTTPSGSFARMRRIDSLAPLRVKETRVNIARMHKGATGWALVSEAP